MKKDFNRNPKGANQWNLISNDEVQKIINSYPSNWTKKDFRGEGINNSKKILSRKETERPGLKFGHTGNSKQPLKNVHKMAVSLLFTSLRLRTDVPEHGVIILPVCATNNA